MAGIQKKPKPDPNAKKSPPAKLTDLQRAERALSSQGRPTTLAECLTDEQRAAIAATLGPDDLATPETAEAVNSAVLEYHATMKATVEGDGPAETTIVDSPLG